MGGSTCRARMSGCAGCSCWPWRGRLCVAQEHALFRLWRCRAQERRHLGRLFHANRLPRGESLHLTSLACFLSSVYVFRESLPGSNADVTPSSAQSSQAIIFKALHQSAWLFVLSSTTQASVIEPAVMIVSAFVIILSYIMTGDRKRLPLHPRVSS